MASPQPRLAKRPAYSPPPTDGDFTNELSPNGFRVVVDIDLIGTFHVMRAAFPYLTKPGASSCASGNVTRGSNEMSATSIVPTGGRGRPARS